MDIITLLYNFYEQQNGFVQFVMTFFFVHIFLRGWVAKKISTWLDERGLWPDAFFRKVKARWLEWWHQPRNQILYKHVYEGHVTNITSCGQGQCANL